jgi:hypothetical protein
MKTAVLLCDSDTGGSLERPEGSEGGRGLDYRVVAQVIDVARGAGWERIGLMTD